MMKKEDEDDPNVTSAVQIYYCKFDAVIKALSLHMQHQDQTEYLLLCTSMVAVLLLIRYLVQSPKYLYAQ